MSMDYKDPSGRSRAAYHRPRLYRYRVADPGLRAAWNRYPGATIGACVVVGRYAYCVKWAWARVVSVPGQNDTGGQP